MSDLAGASCLKWRPLQHIAPFSRGRSRSQTGDCPSQEASTEKLELDVRKNKALDLLDKDFSVSFLEPDTRNYVAFSERFYSICHGFQMENFDSTNNWFICHFTSAISLISVLLDIHYFSWKPYAQRK